MFQGTICPSEGGEAKDFVPPPKGAERSECFAFINNTTSFQFGNRGQTPEERAKTVLDHFQKVQLFVRGSYVEKHDLS